MLNETSSDADIAITGDQLCAAAELIRAGGWIQGGYHDSHGWYCLVGAVVAVLTDHERVVDSQIEDALEDVLITQLGVIPAFRGVANSSITIWNDTEGRTATEVIDVLETAADKLRAEAGQLA